MVEVVEIAGDTGLLLLLAPACACTKGLNCCCWTPAAPPIGRVLTRGDANGEVAKGEPAPPLKSVGEFIPESEVVSEIMSKSKSESEAGSS